MENAPGDRFPGNHPLNLDKLRGRGHLTATRHKDLRFSLEETATFMNDVMGVRMDQIEVRFVDRCLINAFSYNIWLCSLIPIN